jgi:hypothetical protein
MLKSISNDGSGDGLPKIRVSRQLSLLCGINVQFARLKSESIKEAVANRLTTVESNPYISLTWFIVTSPLMHRGTE